MKKRKLWMIINPKSGGGNEFKQKKISIDKYIETTPAKSGSYWVKKAIKAGVKEIIIGGGDGSIQNILKVATEKKLTLGIIPLGTGNVLARNLEIPLEEKKAIKVALHGNIKEIDVAEANGNYFGVIAGMGVDVDAMGKTKKTMKGRLGVLAYVLTGLKSLTKKRDKYRVIIDSKHTYTFRAKSIMVANMAKTVSDIEVAPGAGSQTGNLRVVVIMTRSIGSWIDLLIKVLRGEVKKSPYYKIFKAKTVEVYPLGKPKKYECDGEVFPPVDKLEIIVHPKALKVRVPMDSNPNSN